jgi:hypothetical protein
MKAVLKKSVSLDTYCISKQMPLDFVAFRAEYQELIGLYEKYTLSVSRGGPRLSQAQEDKIKQAINMYEQLTNKHNPEFLNAASNLVTPHLPYIP